MSTMSEQPIEEGAPVKKEAAVLTEASLTHLAKEMAPKAMVMAMYLNIPTTTLVHMSLAASCKGTAEEAFSTELLLHWKKMRETAKEKDKVADMERALREMDKQELADVFMDRHQGQMELSADCFPAH